MAEFYTHVDRHKKHILYSGYKDGKRIHEKIEYKPSAYMENSGEKNPEFISLYNKLPLTKIQKNSIYEFDSYVREMKDIGNVDLFGNKNHVISFITDKFPDDIQYDSNKINIFSFDIEVDISNGYPDMDRANKRINSISIKSSKNSTYHLLALKDYDKSKAKEDGLDIDPANIKFEKFDSEELMLKYFISLWKNNYPDIITGWNCIPVGQTVWGKNAIYNIENCPDKLFSSHKKASSPVFTKEKIAIKLANGNVLYTSEDHKLFYKKFDNAHNANFMAVKDEITTTGDLLDNRDANYSYYLPITIGHNANPDMANITDEQLYLLGHNFIDANRKINLHEMSKLSTRQFYVFISGMIDNYGVYGIGKFKNIVGITNFKNSIQEMFELALWNGLFCHIASNDTIYFSNLNTQKVKLYKKYLHDAKQQPNTKMFYRTREPKKTPYRRVHNYFYTRIEKIYRTGEFVDMMDIETSDHTFVSSGVKVHNCKFFDVQYIITRILRLLGEKYVNELSPFGIVNPVIEKAKFGKENPTYEIAGMTVIDYMDIFKKFGYKYGTQETYKLDHIAHVILGEKKIAYSEYSGLTELYDKNPQKYLSYNIKDTWLVQRFEDKVALLGLVMTMAYDAGVNYKDTLGTVGIWEAILYKKLRQKGFLPPLKKGAAIIPEDEEELLGGYVKEPIPGKYRWVTSFDLNSLYPHIFLGFNMSMETIMKGDNSYRLERYLKSRNEPFSDDPTEENEIREYINSGEFFKDHTNITENLFGDVKNTKRRLMYSKAIKTAGKSVGANAILFKNDERGIIPEIIKEAYAERKKTKDLMLAEEAKYEKIKEEAKRRGIVLE